MCIAALCATRKTLPPASVNKRKLCGDGVRAVALGFRFATSCCTSSYSVRSTHFHFSNRFLEVPLFTVLHYLKITTPAMRMLISLFCFLSANYWMDFPSSKAFRISGFPSMSPISPLPPARTLPRFFHFRCSIKWL